MSSNVLVGTAIGDALGVPFETKSSDYQQLIDWDGYTYLGSVHHKSLPGQYSDDTQMSLMIAESLIENSGFNPDDLSKRYVHWIKSGIARGYGGTTLKAINALDAGVHWSESGVIGSQGNGTAMRAAPFGVFFRKDIPAAINALKIDAAITHRSPDAEAGSLAIGLAAAFAANKDTDNLIERIRDHLPESNIKKTLFLFDDFVAPHLPHQTIFQLLGTKGDVKQTVPAALYCFLKFKEYNEAVIAAIKAGGDTDTTAAIVGGLFAARDGVESIDHRLYGVEGFDTLIELDKKLLGV